MKFENHGNVKSIIRKLDLIIEILNRESLTDQLISYAKGGQLPKISKVELSTNIPKQ